MTQGEKGENMTRLPVSPSCAKPVELTVDLIEQVRSDLLPLIKSSVSAANAAVAVDPYFDNMAFGFCCWRNVFRRIEEEIDTERWNLQTRCNDLRITPVANQEVSFRIYRVNKKNRLPNSGRKLKEDAAEDAFTLSLNFFDSLEIDRPVVGDIYIGYDVDINEDIGSITINRLVAVGTQLEAETIAIIYDSRYNEENSIGEALVAEESFDTAALYRDNRVSVTQSSQSKKE